jgi:hypothetical protein
MKDVANVASGNLSGDLFQEELKKLENAVGSFSNSSSAQQFPELKDWEA